MKPVALQPGAQDFRQKPTEESRMPGGGTAKLPSLLDRKHPSGLDQNSTTMRLYQKQQGESALPVTTAAGKSSLAHNRGRDCYCDVNDGKDVRCSTPTCNVAVHSCCINQFRTDYGEIECSRCTILANDPLAPVKQVLVEPSRLASGHKYSFHLSLVDHGELQKTIQRDFDIEIRCLKIDGEHFFEQTWPDKGEIGLNGKIIREFQPLARNSALKKRKDEKHRLQAKDLDMGTNQISIKFENCLDGKNSKNGPAPKYIFAVLWVRRLTPSQLLEQIKVHNSIDEHQSRKRIQECLFDNKEINLSEVPIHLICKITLTYLENPAKGKYCTHMDCFNLKSFLDSMATKTPRNWMCPLCRKPCYKIVVDKFVQNICEEPNFKAMKPQLVYFRKDGSFMSSEEVYKVPKVVPTKAVDEFPKNAIDIDDDEPQPAIQQTVMLGKRQEAKQPRAAPGLPVIQDADFLKHLYLFAKRKNYGLPFTDELDPNGFHAFRDKLKQRLESDLIAKTCFQRLHEMTILGMQAAQYMPTGLQYKKTAKTGAEPISNYGLRYLESTTHKDKGLAPASSSVQPSLLETIMCQYQLDLGSKQKPTGLPGFADISSN